MLPNAFQGCFLSPRFGGMRHNRPLYLPPHIFFHLRPSLRKLRNVSRPKPHSCLILLTTAGSACDRPCFPLSMSSASFILAKRTKKPPSKFLSPERLMTFTSCTAIQLLLSISNNGL